MATIACGEDAQQRPFGVNMEGDGKCDRGENSEDHAGDGRVGEPVTDVPDKSTIKQVNDKSVNQIKDIACVSDEDQQFVACVPAAGGKQNSGADGDPGGDTERDGADVSEVKMKGLKEGKRKSSEYPDDEQQGFERAGLDDSHGFADVKTENAHDELKDDGVGIELDNGSGVRDQRADGEDRKDQS